MVLRYELKTQFLPLVSDAEYDDLREMLKQAREKAEQHHVYLDCEKGENKAEVKKKLLYVSEKENLPLKVQSLRGKNSLRLTFTSPANKRATRTRMSAEEGKSQILVALKKAKQPLSRKDVLETTDVNAASWNLRIKELVEAGLVKRTGSKRETKYTIK